MKHTWLKLYFEILDDPKMGRLSDHLWRRAIEIFLLAGEQAQDGLLPSVDDMSWRLRTSVEELTEILQVLAGLEIVHETPEGWVVTHFKSRQYSESLERVRRYRNAKSNAESNGYGSGGSSVTVLSSSSSSSDSDSLDSRGGGGVGEEEFPMPETPAQAMQHPDIQLFKQVCGRIPGDRDYVPVIETIRFLGGQHGTGEQLVAYLKPYWTAWSTRKNRDGKLYKQSSLVWLYEWAMNGQIPPANGHEPRQAESTDDIIRKVAQSGRR